MVRHIYIGQNNIICIHQNFNTLWLSVKADTKYYTLFQHLIIAIQIHVKMAEVVWMELMTLLVCVPTRCLDTLQEKTVLKVNMVTQQIGSLHILYGNTYTLNPISSCIYTYIRIYNTFILLQCLCYNSNCRSN